MSYHVVYDGNCNLCVTFTKLLEQFDRASAALRDRGQLFDYIPMQDEATLQQFDITSEDCQMGIILIDGVQPQKRWQGSNAVEEITTLLPLGDAFITAYRALPGIKDIGDRAYEQVRDNRYQWFGKRDATYYSEYPFGCSDRSLH